MSHHSQHHFITQYISLRGTAVNEFYGMIRMGVAGHVRFVLENIHQTEIIYSPSTRLRLYID